MNFTKFDDLVSFDSRFRVFLFFSCVITFQFCVDPFETFPHQISNVSELVTRPHYHEIVKHVNAGSERFIIGIGPNAVVAQDVVKHDECQVDGQMNQMRPKNLFPGVVVEIEFASEQTLRDRFNFPAFKSGHQEIQEKNGPATGGFESDESSVKTFRTRDPKTNARDFVDESQNQKKKNR